MDYINPFGMAQNQNPVPSNPFWSGMLGQRNQANAYPFMQNAYESSNVDLRKKLMEQGEFESPLAQEARRTKMQHGIMGQQEEMRAMPLKTDADMEGYRQKIRELPSLTDEKIAKARETIQKVEGTPYKELVNQLGSMFDVLHQLPNDTQRAQMYLRGIARFRMTNPGVDIPEHLRTYDPNNTMGELGAIRYGQLMTPEQVGKERVKHIEGQYGLTREQMEQRGAGERTAVTAGATRYSADKASERAGANETPQKSIARLKKELRKNPGNQEAMDELRGYLQDDFAKYVRALPEAGALSINAISSDPNERVRYLERMQEIQSDYYKQHGIDTPMYQYRVDPKTKRIQRKLIEKKK